MSSKQAQTLKQNSIKSIPNWLILIFFMLTTTIFFWEQLAGNSWFWEDFIEYVFPVQTFAAREFAHGNLPFWNPYSFSGMPFLADLQVGFFYPLNRILSLFVTSDGSLPFGVLQFMVILHFFISQVNMFFFARNLKISIWGSVIAAVTYSFSMLLVCHVIHPMMLQHLVWLPLIFLYFKKAIDENRYDFSIISGLILGMTLLSGHPQMTLYIFLLLGIYFLFEIIFQLKEKSKLLLNKILIGVLPFVIGVGIFAIQYLPAQELANYSIRAEMTYEKSAEGSLEYKQLFTAVMPHLFGYINGSNTQTVPFYMSLDSLPAPYYYYWETAFYFGIGALLLGIFALLAFKQLPDKKFALFLVIITLFGLLYSLGGNFFLHYIFYQLPFFGTFRNPARMMFFVIFAFSIFAAMGFDLILKQNSKLLKKIIISAIILTVIALFGGIGIFSALLETPSEYSSNISTGGFIALLFILLIFVSLYLLNKNKISQTFAGVAISIIIFIDLFAFGSGFNRGKTNPKDKYTISAEMKQTFTPKSIDSLFRVVSRLYNPPVMTMNRNQGMLDSLMLIEGYNPLVLQRVNAPYESHEDIYKLQNVKFQLIIDQASGRPVFRENTDYFPRAWMVYDYVVLDSTSMVSAFKNKEYDVSKTALIEKNIDMQLGSVPIFSEIQCLEYKHNKIVYKVNTANAGILCMSEIWYPAWKATIENISQQKTYNEEVLRVNYSKRGVVVPNGESIITLRYKSDAFSNGLIISFITLLASLGGLFFIIIRNRKGM